LFFSWPKVKEGTDTMEKKEEKALKNKKKGAKAMILNRRKMKKRKNKARHCYGCKTNIYCFIRRNYRSLLSYNNKKRILVARLEFSLENHFLPQSWYCSFDKHLADFKIVQYPELGENLTNFIDEINAVFAKNDVPEDLLTIIKSQLMLKKTKHSTSDSNKAKIYRERVIENRNLLDIVIKTYYYDFMIFNFTVL
jgi:hypothetical protein